MHQHATDVQVTGSPSARRPAGHPARLPGVGSAIRDGAALSGGYLRSPAGLFLVRHGPASVAGPAQWLPGGVFLVHARMTYEGRLSVHTDVASSGESRFLSSFFRSPCAATLFAGDVAGQSVEHLDSRLPKVCYGRSAASFSREELLQAESELHSDRE